MSPRRAWQLLLLISMALAAGCTGVAGPGGAVVPSLIAARRQSATALEAGGQLRESLNEWKVALTIDPTDSAALEAKARLEERIARALADTLARAHDALKRRVHLEARRQFLIALALDPTNREAFDALQNEAKEVRFINHVVRGGETVSSIAALYYGDRSRSDILWETNQLSVNSKLAPGTTLRIPEIPGLPFGRQEPPRPTAPRRDAASEPIKSEVPAQEEEESYAHPMLAEAKDALERREFSLALATVDRFLSLNPRNTEATEIKRNALFQQGKAFLDQKKWADSLAAFNQVLKLNPKDQESLALLTNVKAQLVQDHYNQGIRYFREEKLAAAIGEWRAVLQYDASHAGARKNIDQAERLLKGLQQRQQKKTPG